MMKKEKRYSFGRNLVTILSLLAAVGMAQIAVAQITAADLQLGFAVPGRLYIGFSSDDHITLGGGSLEPPTNVSATDGTSTSEVTVTWTKSSGATGYRVYRDGSNIGGLLGDVATYSDVGADPPTITAGTASASDGTSSTYVRLLISGESANPGTEHNYSVKAVSASETSGDSNVDTGYIGVGSLSYQWQRSAADSDATYGNIAGATTEPFNDTGGVVTPDGRYYRCVMQAAGASNVTTAADRGYMAAGTTDSIGSARGRTILGSGTPVALAAALLIGTVRAVQSRGNPLEKLFKGLMTGLLTFVLAWALLAAVIT